MELSDYILTHPEKPWNWFNLSCNPNITIEFIEAHPEKPWNWFGVSYNPNLTFEYIEAHPDYSWNWTNISSNKFRLDPFFQRFNYEYILK